MEGWERGGKVDLIYLDPPFSSKANCSVLFGEEANGRSARRLAFADTRGWGLA